jgi:hypothetical protein
MAGWLRFSMVAGFQSEWGLALPRYRRPLHVGTPGRIKLKSAAAVNSIDGLSFGQRMSFAVDGFMIPAPMA